MGGSLSLLGKDQLEKVLKETPFDKSELEKILTRYSAYDKSDRGSQGIPNDEVLLIPEFLANPFINLVVQKYVDQKTRRLYPLQFIYMLASLSSRTDVDKKRKLLWDLLDVHETGVLEHEEVFRMMKVLYHGTLTDDQLLDLTFTALSHHCLETQGKISYQDFTQLIPDIEVQQRLTVELYLP